MRASTIYNFLGAIAVAAVLGLATAGDVEQGASSQLVEGPVDVVDEYAGVVEQQDMMRCCGCHDSQCRGTPDPAAKQPKRRLTAQGEALQAEAVRRLHLR